MKRMLAVGLAFAIVLTMWSPSTTRAAAGVGAVVVVDSYSFVDSIANTHVVGGVQNQTGWPVEYVKVSVAYYDASDALIAEDWSYSGFDVLDPALSSGFSGAGPFEIITTLIKPPARYELSVDWQFSDDFANANFQIGGLAVNNINTTVAKFVKVAAFCTGTRPDGRVGLVGVHWTYVDSNNTSDIQPGQAATFTLYPEPNEPAHLGPCYIRAQSSSPPSMIVTLMATPAATTYRKPITFTGVAKPNDPVSVRLFLRGGGYRQVAATTADTAGNYQVTVPLTFTGTVYASANGWPTVPVLVVADALVSLKSSASTIRRGQAVTLSGTVRPAYAGEKVVIQRQVSGVWKKFATVILDDTSAFTYRWIPKAAGTYNLRAFMSTQLDSSSGVSTTRKVVIR